MVDGQGVEVSEQPRAGGEGAEACRRPGNAAQPRPPMR
jgi:hypothetical protein